MIAIPNTDAVDNRPTMLWISEGAREREVAMG